MNKFCCYFFAILALSALAVAVAADAPHAERPAWDKDTLRLLASLPIQDSGRVKPLDTYASFELLKLNGRRTCKTPDGKSLTALEWLLDVMFYPELAKDYPAFSIDSSDVVVAIGLMPHEKKRDRYSYNELRPGRDTLLSLAANHSKIPAEQRNSAQAQILRLAQNVTEYEAITHYADFARESFPVEPGSVLAILLPDKTEAALADVLRVASNVRSKYQTLVHQTETDNAGLQAEKESLNNLFHRLDGIRRDSDALALFPPSDSSVKEWLTPSGLVLEGFQKGQIPSAELDALAAFETIVRSRGDAVQRDQAAAAFLAKTKTLAVQRGEYGKIVMEVAYYKAGFFSRALNLYIISFMLVALTWLVPRNRLLNVATLVAFIGPTVLLVAGITMRCIIRDRPPATTLYETILFITATAVVASLFLEWLGRQRIALSVGTILAVVGMFLANKYEAVDGTDTMPSMVAVLDTNFWLATHVTTIAIGYAVGFVSAAIAHVYIVGKLFGIRKNDTAFYSTLMRAIYGTFCFGFFFTFVGTLLGGIWADESWGRFWGWDPKENGALLIVLWQLAALHARVGGYIRDLGLAMAAVFCGMVVAFSWWGVNLLGVGLHSYGFTSGAMTSLTVFWAIETVVLFLGGLAWARKPSIEETTVKREPARPGR